MGLTGQLNGFKILSVDIDPWLTYTWFEMSYKFKYRDNVRVKPGVLRDPGVDRTGIVKVAKGDYIKVYLIAYDRYETFVPSQLELIELNGAK